MAYLVSAEEGVPRVLLHSSSRVLSVMRVRRLVSKKGATNPRRRVRGASREGVVRHAFPAAKLSPQPRATTQHHEPPAVTSGVPLPARLSVDGSKRQAVGNQDAGSVAKVVLLLHLALLLRLLYDRRVHGLPGTAFLSHALL